MAGDNEKNNTQLQRLILSARQEFSFRKLHGYGPSREEVREAMHERKLSDSPLVSIAGIDGNPLEQMFIRDVKAGSVLSVEIDIQSGIDVNAQDKFGMTALHYAAATGFRPCIRLLVNSGRCNYLLKDNKGRLASELAYEWGKDYAVGLLLQKKEVRQAYEESRSPPADTPGDDDP